MTLTQWQYGTKDDDDDDDNDKDEDDLLKPKT